MTTFLGTVTTDFIKNITLDDTQKSDLIDYAGTDFLSLRTSLIDYIKAAYPLDYQNFSESDLGVMLIELVAYMGAVLSLKADLLANENYIATAKNRHSVKKLLELVGIRLRGPTSAVAQARLTLATAVTQPYLTLNADNRSISITSPEDGGPLIYTIYKIQGGKVMDLKDVLGDITLYGTEATTPASPTVWNNVALLEGNLVLQTGTFGAYGNGIPTITLNKSPVIEGSVQVFVNAPTNAAASGTYQAVESVYFASGITNKIYQVNLDQTFGGILVFGDGFTGVRPPPGATYAVTYRVGGGTRGNIQTSFLNATITTYDGGSVGSPIQGTMENTSMATGGADAETVAHAKKYGPLFFKSQDRLVTLGDYVAHTNKFISSHSTVGKATAAVRMAFSSANVIDVYVLEKASDLQLQKASSSFKINLLSYLNDKKMLTDEIVIVDGVIRALDLIMTVKCDRELEPLEASIKAQVRDSILTFFNVDNVSFGKDLSLSDLSRTIFKEVEQVRFASVDNLDSDIAIDFNEIIQLNNVVINVVFV